MKYQNIEQPNPLLIRTVECISYYEPFPDIFLAALLSWDHQAFIYTRFGLVFHLLKFLSPGGDCWHDPSPDAY